MIIKKNINNAAAIVIEPCREELPEKKYMLALKKIAKKNNAILIYDEITSGYRLNTGGAHKILKVDPDMVIYGKTIANGIPMAAIIGKKEIMNYALKTFVSSVFWTEKIGPASALAFIKKHKKLNVGKKLTLVGRKVKRIWAKAALVNNLEIEISPPRMVLLRWMSTRYIGAPRCRRTFLSPPDPPRHLRGFRSWWYGTAQLCGGGHPPGHPAVAVQMRAVRRRLLRRRTVRCAAWTAWIVAWVPRWVPTLAAQLCWTRPSFVVYAWVRRVMEP